MAERLLTTTDVMDRTGLGRSTLWRMEKEGRFPKRRKLVGHRVGWIESEVDDWIESRPVAEGEESDAAA